MLATSPKGVISAPRGNRYFLCQMVDSLLGEGSKLLRLQTANGFHTVYEVPASAPLRLQDQRNEINSLRTTLFTIGNHFLSSAMHSPC